MEPLIPATTPTEEAFTAALPDPATLAHRLRLSPKRSLGAFRLPNSLPPSLTQAGFRMRALCVETAMPDENPPRPAPVDDLLCAVAVEGSLPSSLVDRLVSELDPDGHLWIIAWRTGAGEGSKDRPAQGEGAKARVLFSSFGFVEDRSVALSNALYAIRFRRA